MPDRSAPSPLSRLPKIDTLLALPAVAGLLPAHGRERVAGQLRAMVDHLRRELQAGRVDEPGLAAWRERLPGALRERLESELSSSLVPVINATGVLVHTNLGRSPLSGEAVRRIAAVASGYATLEYNRAEGMRGSRSVHAQRLLARLFPDHAAHVVNNNAAAVLLALNTLAEGKEVIVSRGELVEIGGSFRIPDVMRKSQALLREVGTTNRTRIADYEGAIGTATGLLLRVHTSNYRIIGFTAQATLPELVELGRRRGLPVMVDQGSGTLSSLEAAGVGDEPTVGSLLEQGADLVTFSGDKLLGGPQAGILVGREELIERIRRNPLSRALRVDKMTYAALEATLAAHVTGTAGTELPVLRMLGEPEASVAARARRLAAALAAQTGGGVEAEVGPGVSVVGGGSAPTTEIPTALVAVRCGDLSADALEARLRGGVPPVIARIESDRLVLDLRTVAPEEEADLLRALAALAGTKATR